MRVTLWGVRGSLPSPRAGTMRYGANTSCVEVGVTGASLVVLDAGSGLFRLRESAWATASRVDLLLTHLHMDHVVGLGFIADVFGPDQELHLWGPASPGADLRSRLGRYLSPPLFPARIDDLPRTISIHEVPAGGMDLPELEVRADWVCHPGPTLGYRLSDGLTSVAYIPDHEPALAGGTRFASSPEWTSGHDLAEGVDLLLHDSQYTEAEYSARMSWGHSSVRDALIFAAATGARHLVTVHHDPSHDDHHLDEMLDLAREAGPHPFELTMGSEGAAFELHPPHSDR